MHVVGITERIDKHEKKKIFIGIGATIICYRRYRNRGILLATGNVEDSVANIDLVRYMEGLESRRNTR